MRFVSVIDEMRRKGTMRQNSQSAIAPCIRPDAYWQDSIAKAIVSASQRIQDDRREHGQARLQSTFSMSIASSFPTVSTSSTPDMHSSIVSQPNARAGTALTAIKNNSRPTTAARKRVLLGNSTANPTRPITSMGVGYERMGHDGERTRSRVSYTRPATATATYTSTPDRDDSGGAANGVENSSEMWEQRVQNQQRYYSRVLSVDANRNAVMRRALSARIMPPEPEGLSARPASSIAALRAANPGSLPSFLRDV